MYSYGDSSWLDLLTAYDGQSISYDSIGNPTSWYDGTTFTWSNGRRLTSAVNSSTGLNNSYTYDMDGLRLTKTVGSVEHKYVWQGSKLVAEYFGGTELEFFYDENGAPYAFSYKATASATPVMYYYVTNLQGDVVSILNASGTSVAEYSYNAWGKVLSATGTMAAINPIRYRGYYFDSDSGLYYLKSRYYDPNLQRFINSDGQLAKKDFVGANLFAYCGNNPVNLSDENGDWPKWLETTVKVASVVIAVAAVVATVAAVSAFTAGTGSLAAVYGATILLGAALSGINGGVANQSKGSSYANGYLGGATGGAIQATCSKTPGGTIVGGAVGVTVGTTITDVMNNLDPDSANSTAQEIAADAFKSGARALVTSSVTAYVGYASDFAVVDNAMGLMPSYTFGFGEAIKAFFGWADDAVVYVWE